MKKTRKARLAISEGRLKNKTPKDNRITVRLSPSELEALTAMAAEAKCAPGYFLRSLLVDVAFNRLQPPAREPFLRKIYDEAVEAA